jgi:hypothetical protein
MGGLRAVTVCFPALKGWYHAVWHETACARREIGIQLSGMQQLIKEGA